MQDCITLENGQTELSPVAKLIIVAYCDEMTASLQYMQAKHQARGKGYPDVIPEYEDHEHDEHDHAEKWLKRLEELGVIIRLDYHQIQDSGNPWTPITTSDIPEQLKILIKAEADARDFYAKVVEAAREAKDWISERIAKEYMDAEEEHRIDLLRILESL